MCDHLRILIVEDEAAVRTILRHLMKPVQAAFPAARITEVESLREMEDVLRTEPPQDIVLLDLTLLDASMEVTLSKLQWIEDRAPVVIVTGSDAEHIRKLLCGRHHEIEIVQKEEISISGRLFGAMIRAITRKYDGREKRTETNLKILRAVCDGKYS